MHLRTYKHRRQNLKIIKQHRCFVNSPRRPNRRSSSVYCLYVDKNVETFKYVDTIILLCILKKETIMARQGTG